MLDALRSQLVQCGSGHYYGRYNTSCPWCKKEATPVRPTPSPSPKTIPAASPSPVNTQPVSPLNAQNPTPPVQAAPASPPTLGISPQNSYQNKKHRSWYAHEIINFIGLIPCAYEYFVDHILDYYLCITVYIIALLARLVKRKSETLPTGPGAKTMAWVNLLLGIGMLCLFIEFNDKLNGGITISPANIVSIIGSSAFMMILYSILSFCDARQKK